jgi:hypothetical protein
VLVCTEYFEYSPCSRQKEDGERAAFLRDGRISIAIKDQNGGYSFETRDCN